MASVRSPEFGDGRRRSKPGDCARLRDEDFRRKNTRICCADVEGDLRRPLYQMAFRRYESVADSFGQHGIVNGVGDVVRLGRAGGDFQGDVKAKSLRGVALLRPFADYAFDLKSVKFQRHVGMILQNPSLFQGGELPFGVAFDIIFMSAEMVFADAKGA